MTQLKVAEGEDPLMSRWSAIAGCSQFWTERSTSGEYLCGALHPTLAQHIRMLLRGAYEQGQQVDRLGHECKRGPTGCSPRMMYTDARLKFLLWCGSSSRSRGVVPAKKDLRPGGGSSGRSL
ncbi:hypothetical protein BHM03_00024774 [Ensete ventricosum]|nr:hypothetical protein BHM03_00024774 [Ensete ventricosum]